MSSIGDYCMAICQDMSVMGCGEPISARRAGPFDSRTDCLSVTEMKCGRIPPQASHLAPDSSSNSCRALYDQTSRKILYKQIYYLPSNIQYFCLIFLSLQHPTKKTPHTQTPPLTPPPQSAQAEPRHIIPSFFFLPAFTPSLFPSEKQKVPPPGVNAIVSQRKVWTLSFNGLLY